MKIPHDTPLSFLTVGEFIDLLNSNDKKPLKIKEEKSVEYVYGLNGLAKILGCSKTTAWKVKKSGVLGDSVIQRGRKIIIKKHQAIKRYNDVRN